MRFKKFIASALIAMMSMQALAGCGKSDDSVDESVLSSESVVDETSESESEHESHSLGEEITLNFWYTDANMTDYFTNVVADFTEQHPEIAVDLRMVAATGYFDNINTQSINHSNAVDVYMVHNEDLEQACLAGLAKAYEDSEKYTEGNFGKSAMRAITYNNKKIAYPLYFDGAFMVYNKDYIDVAPTTFDGILGFATQERDEGESVLDNIENFLVWPVSDYTYNYEFLSDSYIVGGINGDNRGQVDLENETVVSTLSYFKLLNEYFALDRELVTEDYCLNYFIEGKSAFTFTKTSGLAKLNEADINYGTACMPDITDTISASALSYTQCLVINPYSTNFEAAKLLVDAVCYDNVASFYETTGFYPSCKVWDYDEIARGVYDNYFDSTPMPKMMAMGDYYIELDILLHKIWDGEGEMTELLSEFAALINDQLIY